jgi:fumarate hydratase, class II
MAKKAHKTGQTLREVALEDGIPEDKLDRLLDYKRMTEGGVL